MDSLPKLIDSHCHIHTLDLADFDQQMAAVIDAARQAGVEKMLCVCIDFEDINPLIQLADQFQEIYTSVGLHPNSNTNTKPDPEYLAGLATHPSCIAMGETGLDYYRTEDEAEKEIQRQWFRAHIRASDTLQKPLIIHTRSAREDTIAVMKEERAETAGGVIHCFTESWDMAKKALDLGFYISFSGIVTFKNASELREVAQKTPLDRILIETDAPYLAPVPFRGKQNHPALVRYVAECLSEVKQVNLEDIAHHTRQNFYTCFKLDQRI